MKRFCYMCVAVVLGVFFLACQTGCETKAQTGALVGGAGGAAVGAGIGSMSHSRAGEGALIGGAVGAIGGYIVGNEMDKSDQKEREKAIDRSTRAKPSETAPRLTQSQVIQWSRDGVSDEIIIDRVERSGTVFTIRAADENKLRDAGVSESVIRAMKDTQR